MHSNRISDEVKTPVGQHYLVIEDNYDAPISSPIECWSTKEIAETRAQYYRELMANLKQTIPDNIWDIITEDFKYPLNPDEIYNKLQSSEFANKFTKDDIVQMIDYEQNMHKIGYTDYYVFPINYFG